MSLVFTGPYAAFHHQCVKMVNMLINYCEQNMSGLNPHAQPHVTLKQEEAETTNNRKDKGRAENHRKSKQKLDVTLKNKNTNSMVNVEWTREGRIFQPKHVQKEKSKEKIEKVKCSKNTNRHDVLNNKDVQDERNEDLKLEIESANETHEVERSNMKEKKEKIIDVNGMTIDAIDDEMWRCPEHNVEDNFVESSTIKVQAAI